MSSEFNRRWRLYFLTRAPQLSVRYRFGVSCRPLTCVLAWYSLVLEWYRLPVRWTMCHGSSSGFFSSMLFDGEISRIGPSTTVRYLHRPYCCICKCLLPNRRPLCSIGRWHRDSCRVGVLLVSSVNVSRHNKHWLHINYSLQYPMNGELGALTIQRWWGNTVFKNTYDWKMIPLKTLLPGEKFG